MWFLLIHINGVAHGPEKSTTTCQLHMRKFKDGQTIYIEPFRAKAFPIIKDLIVDRSSLTGFTSGGYVSINTSRNTQMEIVFQFQKVTLIKLLMRLLVLVVGHVLLLVKMPQQCFLLQLKFHSMLFCLKVK